MQHVEQVIGPDSTDVEQRASPNIARDDSPTPRATLWDIFVVFMVLGATSWGGMYVVLSAFEKELERRRWLTPSELQEVIATATLVPGPTFVAFGGIIGHLLRGWAGAAVGIIGLMLPPALLVLAIMFFVPAELLYGPLAPFTRSLSVIIAGVLIGTGVHFVMREDKSNFIGMAIFIGATMAMVMGAPVIVVVLIGVILGAVLLKNGGRQRK